MNIFSWPVRVYYEDTDSGGVVYYANYLRFMERARTEWLRSFGVEQDVLREQGVIFAVRHVDVDYIKPARFNDSLDVTVTVAERGRASMTLAQQVLKKNGSETLILCQGQIKIACLNAEAFRPQAIPKYIQTEIERVC